LKALVKATMNEESVLRHREDEKIISTMNRRFDSIEKIVGGKLGEEVEKLVLKIETNRIEFTDLRDLHSN